MCGQATSFMFEWEKKGLGELLLPILCTESLDFSNKNFGR